MKKLLLSISIVMFLGCAGYAADKQENKQHFKNVPGAVIKAFAAMYPNAVIKKVEKGKENKNNIEYEIESIEGSIKRDVSYHADGTIIDIEETIDAESLPEAVRQTIKAAYPKGKIKKAEKLTENNVVNYEVKIHSGKIKEEIVMDETGKILGKNKGD